MNVCFNGCSYTDGMGFPDDQKNLFVFDRLLEKKFCFNRTNIAVGGSSNYEIFMRSADAIMSDTFDCVVTQWSALHRLTLYPGPNIRFGFNINREFKYRHIHIDSSEKQKLIDTVLMLNGDYNNIIDLVKFTNILKTIAQINGTRLVFVNGLVPWKKDLITPLSDDLNSSLSEYTKSILDFKHRNDNEVIELFQELQKFAKQIDQSLWVNLFDSWHQNVSDVGPVGHHPGIKSNQWMADKLSEHFIKNQIL